MHARGLTLYIYIYIVIVNIYIFYCVSLFTLDIKDVTCFVSGLKKSNQILIQINLYLGQTDW